MVNSFKYCKCKPLLHLNRYFHARRRSKSPCFYVYHISTTSVSNNLVILKNKEKQKQTFKSIKEQHYLNYGKFIQCKPLLHLNRYFHARRWSKSPCFYIHVSYIHICFQQSGHFKKKNKKQTFKSIKEQQYFLNHSKFILNYTSILTFYNIFLLLCARFQLKKSLSKFSIAIYFLREPASNRCPNPKSLLHK